MPDLTESERSPVRRWVVAGTLLMVLLMIAYVASARGPYFWPVSVAPGPCLADWTTPLSYPLLTGERASPMDEARVELGGGTILICYGRPSAKDRKLFGAEDALVPPGRLWRTGANEPTRLFTDIGLDVGGVRVPPGRYSLYTMPFEQRWIVALNRSTFHWGNDFSDRVRAQEIGRTVARVDSGSTFVEKLTINLEPTAPDGGNETAELVISWGNVRVAVPVSVLPAAPESN